LLYFAKFPPGKALKLIAFTPAVTRSVGSKVTKAILLELECRVGAQKQ
jgi:hypothetical protein